MILLRFLWLWLGLSVMLGSAGFAQTDPATRPKLLWHIGATRYHNPRSFTEDGQFLLTQAQGRLIQVYRVYGLSGASLLDSSTPLGHALVTYDFAQGLACSFTDRTHLTEVNANQEYVVGFTQGRIFVWPFVRGSHPNVFRGAYLGRVRSYGVQDWRATYWYDAPWERVALLLRGDRTDRRFNLLAVAGDENGNLRIVYINPTLPHNTPLNPVVVNNAHAGPIICMAYDPNTRMLYTGGADGTIRRWQVGLSASNVPSLTLQQVVAAHMEPVVSLALGTVEGTRYLVSLADDNTMAGWRLSSSGMPFTPTWTRPIESLGIYEVYDTIQWTISPGIRLGSAPYGDAERVTLHLSMNNPSNHLGSGSCYFVNPATGEVEAFVRFSDNELPPATLISPLIDGNRYLVHTAAQLFQPFVHAGALGLTPFKFGRRLVETTPRPPVSALHLPDSGNNYVAGFADGSFYVYTLGGSAPVASTNIHRGWRVVGARLIPGATTYTLSLDNEGFLAVHQLTSGSLAPVLSRNLASESPPFLSAHALDYRHASGLVAVAGTGTDGRPLVRTFRLTLTPSVSLTADATITIPTENAPALSVRILADDSLVISTGTRVSRWARSGSGYTLAQTFDFRWSDATVIAAGSEGYLWAGMRRSHYPQVRLLANNASVYEPPQTGFDTNVFTRAYPIEALGNEEAVWGMAFRNPAGDTGFLVARGRTLLRDRDSVSQTTMHVGWHAIMPDAVEALTARGETVIVGLANGQIYECFFPDMPMTRIGYDVISARFSVKDSVVAAYLTEFPRRHHTQFYTGASRNARLNLNNGTVINSAFDGFNFYAQWDMAVQLSPSGNALYGYLPGGNLWGQNANTFAPLFASTTLNPARWWLLAIDGQHLGLLRVDPNTASFTHGGNTYNRARYVMEFYRHNNNPSQPPTLVGSYLLHTDDDLGWWWRVGSSDYGLETLRWDLNADRSLVAVSGRHNVWNGSSFVQNWRLIILRRAPGSWSNWTVGIRLESPTDFQGSYPTYVRFHPTLPNVLYVGLADGRVIACYLDETGFVLRKYEFAPSRNPGAVGALDVGVFTFNGKRYSLLAFGGSNGLSIWAGSPCLPEQIREIHFYDQDVAFFSDAGSIQVSQTAPESLPIIVYSNGFALSAASIDNIPSLPCPEDIDRNGIVDDADLLRVLFNFGRVGAYPEDINCDGIVDDADLLLVLFSFGNTC